MKTKWPHPGDHKIPEHILFIGICMLCDCVT